MKTILVIGSTGQQGGSVLRYLYEDGTFHVRAMVRDLSSEKSKTLLEKYPKISLVAADLNDVDSLKNAMEGCYGVFGVTNFWDPSVGYEGEIQHGKNIGDACKHANIQHLVFSTLEGNTGVAHMDSKHIANEYIKSIGVPLTSLYTSAYYENINSFFAPKNIDGTMVFAVAQKPTTKVPMYSVSETGGWVLQSFLHPSFTIGKDIAAVSEYLTYGELAHIYGEVMKVKSVFNTIPLEVFRTFARVEEIADMFHLYDEMSEGTKVDIRKQLIQEQKIHFAGETFEAFLNRTKY